MKLPKMFSKKTGAMGLENLQGVALAFLLTGVFFAIALVVMATLKTNILASSVMLNSTGGTGNSAVRTNFDTATTAIVNSLAEIPNNWLLLLAVIVAAAVVISIVVMSIGRSSGANR